MAASFSKIRSVALEIFAWGSLVIAFVVGQIASQVDYERLLLDQFPDVSLERVATSGGPAVFRVTMPDGERSPDPVIMAEGRGYGGPLVVGIRARRTDEGAVINRVVMLNHRETPSFMGRVMRSSFFEQFAGMSVTANFLLGTDVDAVSGATVTSEAFAQAVRDAVHQGATQQLGLSKTWQDPTWRLTWEVFLLVALFALALFRAYHRGAFAKRTRVVVMAGSLLFVGFYTNASVSLGQLAGIVMGYVPNPQQHPLWWVMILGTISCVIVLGRNIYCHQICPFKVVQDLAQKISGIRFRIRPDLQRRSRSVIFTLSWVALMLIFLSAHPALGSYEPFAMMFSLEGLGIQWYILPATLLGSLFVPSFWCRMFCPVGLYLNELVRLRRKLIRSLKRNEQHGAHPVGGRPVKIVDKQQANKENE